MGKKNEILEQKMCKEIETIEEKYRGGAEMSDVDLKRLDLLYHTLKSKATYDAMAEAKEMEMRGGMSHMDRSYDDGYSGRRSMDNGPGYSGHYPPMMPMQYYADRRW